jgi:hypothetical protein
VCGKGSLEIEVQENHYRDIDNYDAYDDATIRFRTREEASDFLAALSAWIDQLPNGSEEATELPA